MFEVLLIVFGVVSLAAFLLYGADKYKAKRNLWRIPERVLLAVGFFGGAVGALLAMRAFRHKTKHAYFYVVNVLGLLVQLALLGYFAMA